MEINLILAAKGWQLGSQLEKSKTAGGVMIIKNVPERTYIAVTSKQWQVLTQFRETKTVPQVLEKSIEDRVCPALGEFYELILKAVRARVLVEPNQSVAPIPAINWPVSVRPSRVRYGIWAVFFMGITISIWLRPALPGSVLDVIGGIMILAVGLAAGTALSASLLRGGGGEVYLQGRWMIRLTDACMLPPPEERLIMLGTPAMLAAATAFSTWYLPGGSFFPLMGMLLVMRPVLSGRVSRMIRVGAANRLSDAEHAFLFPPNRTPRVRWKMLRAGLGSPTTWYEIAYGTLWTFALGYFVGQLTEVEPWKIEFWRTQGPRLALTVVGSLGLLGLGYACSEFYIFAKDRALARRETFRQWYNRWFGRGKQLTDESARLRAVLRSPLLRMLPPPAQQSVAKALRPARIGVWKKLLDFNAPAREISLILSGQVGVYRRLGTGRRVLVQVLCEDDIVGLHSVADPDHPSFLYRTLTPVVLLHLDWAIAKEDIITRFGPAVIANQVQKLPFLARIHLCQNWHIQAIKRFAELSKIVDFVEDEVIIQRGFYSESFYIIFEGEARISKGGRRQAVLKGSDFFGEIGLLQNSNATAQVTAGPNARCLCIIRREFLRFVAHNYSVALELERVSSGRLGRPVFPLSPGNFREI